jgi:hypothetical protein
MALWSEPRFPSSDAKRDQIRRPDDPLDDDGIGPAFLMLAGAAFGITLLGLVIGLGHPEQPTMLADRTLDQSVHDRPANALPSDPAKQ